MSAATSPLTGLRYGITRVCAAWRVARSSFSLERARRGVPATTPTVPLKAPAEGPGRSTMPVSSVTLTNAAPPPSAAVVGPRGPRGPKPRLTDARVLELTREDLAGSPFRGEGHRKVCARLRRAGHRVFARQVLRVMRGAQLLSPHRASQGTVRAHDGRIVTDAPDVMWGTDGMRVETVDEGWVWIFVAVEHWNGEVMGWHVTAKGDRFAALEPIGQGLQRLGRGVARGVGRGLSLRMDHGTQYTSEHFVNALKYWAIERSYGYVAEPETNGVAERFNRTLKAQVIRGRVFRDAGELRAAVGGFIDRYNADWLLEKNGYRSPVEARALNQERLAA